ncbi:MAG: hypothetical protein M9947_08180 [Thermomicrobiales bacterium]|nr:hypothetical protein [Thermomicrobiales bacterium]
MDHPTVVPGLLAGKLGLLLQDNHLGSWAAQKELPADRKSENAPANNDDITSPRFAAVRIWSLIHAAGITIHLID